jgi:hypothetical protein
MTLLYIGLSVLKRGIMYKKIRLSMRNLHLEYFSYLGYLVGLIVTLLSKYMNRKIHFH